jgi:hypothetical protein
MEDSTAMNSAPPFTESSRAPTGPHAEIRQDVFCQECGYNLRGLTSDRCPECGHRLDAVRSPESGIPWVYRRERGRLRAYWQTVWTVMFRHKRFCEELARPVDYRDAQAFRWMTLLHAYAPMVAAVVLAYPAWWPAPFNDRLMDEAFMAMWPAAILLGCLFLFLLAATGIPSYAFHPPELPIEQQNRAVAMSYYASAALAWTPLPFFLGLAGMGLLPRHRLIGEALIAWGILLPVGQWVAWWADLVHIASRIMPQSKRYALSVAIAVPALWLGLAVLTLIALPIAILYVLIIAASLG